MILDEQIKKQVVEHLYWDDRVNAADVRVTSVDGRVVLAGSVPSHMALQAAERDAWSVPGVKSVNNRLIISYAAVPAVPADDEVAATIQSKLLWNSNIDPSTIDISVAAGIVTLEGTVDSYRKKMKAEILAYDVIGVTLVENRLAVVPSRDIVDEVIGEAIVDALDRSGAFDFDTLDVQVENGVVTLSGTVPDARVLRAARDAAAHTPGVVDVRSELEISKEEDRNLIFEV
jgi:osmotically-inducible protein OsmY